MNPINNIKIKNPSQQSTGDHPARPIPAQANPIAPQVGSLPGVRVSERTNNRSSLMASHRSETLVNAGQGHPLSLQDPKARRKAADEAILLGSAKDQNKSMDDRIECAYKISNSKLKDEAILTILKDKNTNELKMDRDKLINLISKLSTQEARDKAYLHEANNTEDLQSRMEYALAASDSQARNESIQLILWHNDVQRDRSKVLDSKVLEPHQLMDLISKLSIQEERDEAYLYESKREQEHLIDRLEYALAISSPHKKDKAILAILKKKNSQRLKKDLIFQLISQQLISQLSTQEKRDEVYLCISKHRPEDLADRMKYALSITSPHKKDEAILAILKENYKNDLRIYRRELENLISELSTKEKRDEAKDEDCLYEAKRRHGLDDRMKYALAISSPHKKDEAILAILQDENDIPLDIFENAIKILSKEQECGEFLGNPASPHKRDEAILAILQNKPARHLDNLNPLLDGLSTQEKRDKALASIATNHKDLSTRIQYALQISDAHSKDDVLLVILLKRGTAIYGDDLNTLLGGLFTQEKRNEAFACIAANQYKDSSTRIQYALQISNAHIKDDMLLVILKGKTAIYGDNLNALLGGLFTEEKRNEAFAYIAADQHKDSSTRIQYALQISDAHIKDEVISGILKAIEENRRLVDNKDIQTAIKSLSTKEKREKAWVNVVRYSNKDINERIENAQFLSNAELKTTVLVELYNEFLGKQGAPLRKIINLIPDPDMQTLARQALADGEQVQLRAPKSARKDLS